MVHFFSYLKASPIYYSNRANCLIEMDRYPEAEQDCLKAIELDPQFTKAYYRLGLTYLI